MKNWILLILTALILLTGCGNKDKSDDIRSEYMSELDEELDKGLLKNYIEGEIKLVNAEPHTVESMQFYEFVFEANLNQEFNNLADKEKYELFKELASQSLRTFCGENSHCEIKNFTFFSKSDTFEVEPSYVFKIAQNGEYYDPYAPTEEQEKINKMYSSLKFIAENVYNLRVLGYPIEHTVTQRKSPDTLYSLIGVQESSGVIVDIAEDIGDEKLIQNTRRLDEKIKSIVPNEREYNNQIVESFLPDMEAIMTAYFPASLEEKVSESLVKPGLGYYYHQLK